MHDGRARRVERAGWNQVQFPGALRPVDIQMGRDGHACFPGALHQGWQQQLEADQLDRLSVQQVSVLPQVARAGVDRAVVLGAATELGQRRHGGECAQDAVVLVAHGAAPAAVG